VEHRSSDREESVGNKGTNLKLDKEDEMYHRKINNEVGFLGNTSVEPQDESRVSSEGHVNGHLGHDSRKEDKKWPRESRSPSKGIGKQKSYYYDEKMEVDESKLSNHRKSPSQSTGDRGEFPIRSRSRSIGARERSRSRSIREEEVHSKRRRYHDSDALLHVDKSKFEYDSDHERIVRQSRDRRHNSRDLVRDEERERSISHSRYVGGEDRHRSRVTHEKERSMDRDMDMDKDLRREKERERIRDSEMDRAQRRDRDRGRSWDRARDMDRKWEIERDRNREREVDRDRRREKESDRSRASERDRDREWEKDRDKVRRESERERRDDRSRNKDRGIVSDWEKYENLEDGYDNGRYKHSRHSRHDEKDYNQDRTRKSDLAKVPRFKNDPLGGDRDKPRRYFF
jgi:serine/threonine-protein kinase PRP4